MHDFITLDIARNEDIEKAIQLIKEGYYIINMGLNLITLTK
jgi:hypothetical protein